MQRNFADPGEIGASAAVVHNGELVVDIWAGHKDEERTQEWERDTITNVIVRKLFVQVIPSTIQFFIIDNSQMN